MNDQILRALTLDAAQKAGLDVSKNGYGGLSIWYEGGDVTESYMAVVRQVIKNEREREQVKT